MSNEEAAAKAAALWDHEGRRGWVAFDSRRIFVAATYAVGENNAVLGMGETWEEAFLNAENRP